MPASVTSEQLPDGTDGVGPLWWLRYLDLGVLALALPIFLVTGLPLLGWGAAAFGWVAQRLIRDAPPRPRTRARWPAC